MIIRDIVVHLIEKQADSGPSNLILSHESIAASPVLEYFLEELNKVYNSKPSKVFGRFTDPENVQNSTHNEESEQNTVEIESAVTLANKYPDIVKVLAVGNEAMIN